MSSYDLNENTGTTGEATPGPIVVLAEFVPAPPIEELPQAGFPRRRVRLPLLLFVATCLSTLLAGNLMFGPAQGWQYALAVMTILACHEMGHFLQARRYGVYASFPFFIPMPVGPLGTFGAVIAMDSRMRHRRALFDIGITGPLAGLVPTIVFCVIGLQQSTYGFFPQEAPRFGDPLLLRMLAERILGPMPAGHDILLNPLLFAGWVGLLITSLNLMPIGQLDGGHILYGLLRKRAHFVAQGLLLAAIVTVALNYDEFFGWTLMLFLVVLMGPNHPPTANDRVALGPVRTVLGWLTLAFIPFGFTPTPFVFGS